MNDNQSIFLEKEDIVLRPAEKEDISFLKELVQHPEVRKTLGRPPLPVNSKQKENSLESLNSDDDNAYFIIEYKNQNAGDIILTGLETQYRRGEFGISVHPEFQGNSIGTISLQLILKYGFEAQNLHKIRGGYLEGNIASRRIMEKNGFREEGRERHYKYVDGVWRDVIWMSILENEYANT